MTAEGKPEFEEIFELIPKLDLFELKVLKSMMEDQLKGVFPKETRQIVEKILDLVNETIASKENN